MCFAQQWLQLIVDDFCYLYRPCLGVVAIVENDGWFFGQNGSQVNDSYSFFSAYINHALVELIDSFGHGLMGIRLAIVDGGGKSYEQGFLVCHALVPKGGLSYPNQLKVALPGDTGSFSQIIFISIEALADVRQGILFFNLQVLLYFLNP